MFDKRIQEQRQLELPELSPMKKKLTQAFQIHGLFNFSDTSFTVSLFNFGPGT